jgi:probable F420-dependent oxidoreductase
MRFGLALGNIVAPGETLAECLALAKLAEDHGLDSVWVQDHAAVPAGVEAAKRQPPWLGRRELLPDLQLFEPLTLMSHLAVATQRLTIGSAVLAIPFRHPAVVAKMLAAADLLSGGRIVLGAGTGWLEDEFAALGLGAHAYRRRGRITSEYVRAIKELWLNTGPSHFSGEFVSFAGVGAFPKPQQRPHPPIVFAGGSDAALRRASRLGNGHIASGLDPAGLAERVSRLHGFCRADRRDPAEMEVLLLSPVSIQAAPAEGDRAPLTGSAEQVAEDLRAYERAGLHHLIAVVRSAGESVDSARGTVMRLADEVMPQFTTVEAR